MIPRSLLRSIFALFRLGVLRMSWKIFHDRLLLGRCFRGFVLPVLGYCSAVWCSAADTHLKQLDLVVSGARLLLGVCSSVTMHVVDLWQCYIIMMYKIRCNQIAPSLWCSSCSVCAGASYTLRCDRSSVHLGASLLQNLAV